MHPTGMTCIGIVLFALGVHASAESNGPKLFVFGAWARSVAECTEPELTFARDRARISIDADGQPVAFDYTDIAYRSGADDVVVELKKQHPYGRTETRDTLHFKRIDRNTIALQRSKAKDIRFNRCAG